MNHVDKRYQVIVSDRAAEMLVNHARFLAQVSETAADKLRVLIIEKMKALETMPQRYSWFNAEMIPANKYRKIVIENKYLILYQIRDDIVYVDYILDCRQEYTWLLRKE